MAAAGDRHKLAGVFPQANILPVEVTVTMSSRLMQLIIYTMQLKSKICCKQRPLYIIPGRCNWAVPEIQPVICECLYDLACTLPGHQLPGSHLNRMKFIHSVSAGRDEF